MMHQTSPLMLLLPKIEQKCGILSIAQISKSLPFRMPHPAPNLTLDTSHSSHDHTAPVVAQNGCLDEPEDPIDDSWNTPSGSNSEDLSNHHSTSRSVSNCEDGSSSDDASTGVLIFNPGEGLFTDERLDQSRKPAVGNLIAFFSQDDQIWVEATITKDLSHKWNHYYNILYHDGTPDGLYLIPDTRWTLISNGQRETERLGSTFNIPNILPTPESSFLPRTDPTLDTNVSVQLSSGLDSSLQWDDYDTQLVPTNPCDVILDKVQNLEHVLPLPAFPAPSMENFSHIELDAASNLNLFLPLSSTPRPTRHRLNHPRRALPIEEEHRRSTLPALFRRFLPFRKKR